MENKMEPLFLHSQPEAKFDHKNVGGFVVEKIAQVSVQRGIIGSFGARPVVLPHEIEGGTWPVFPSGHQVRTEFIETEIGVVERIVFIALRNQVQVRRPVIGYFRTGKGMVPFTKDFRMRISCPFKIGIASG